MQVLGDIIRLGAKRYGERTAVMLGDDRMSYQRLDTEANRLAQGLIAEGVVAGDRVALYALNSLEYVVVAAAVAKCGAVLQPINFRYQADELVYVIDDAAPRALIFGPQFSDLVADSRKRFATPPRLISLAGPTTNDWSSYGDLLAGGTEKVPEAPPEAPAALMYTSGTTGTPKGVLYPHRSYLATYQALIVEGDLEPGDVTLVCLPLFHQAGLHALVMPTLMLGGKVVLTAGGFDPGEILELTARERVTATMWVPTMLAMLSTLPEVARHDLSALSKIWYGSSPISPTVLEASKAAFGAGFYQWYGQTETGMNSVLRPEDHDTRAAFTGREVYNIELRFVDEAGRDVGVGEVGEIICSTANHGMIEYLNQPEATAATVIDGWIHTGDLARREEDGYFTVVDRLRDLIISGAENVYPKEIEDVVAAHPAVAEVAVFGVPDEIYGEAVCAAVALKDGSEVAPGDIVAFCAERLAGYKKPKNIEFHTELPKNAMGKVTKNVLREPHWAGRDKKI
ncbi:MAG TPA: long-chain-fatty-acid--CoA ligase [Alphaproteobacteria bacterium]|jgi:acyl-CoA synthetase (AMP-forming)/AMP-acid ligase II|nr:long-chain-fatty-acid--CoA ligase [Alphaproteobacteria bacterium]